MPLSSSAAIVEDVIDVPVTVRTIRGEEVSQPIKVTVFRDDRRDKAPYLVLNHGRPVSKDGFAAMKRQRFPEISRYLVARGFVVLVPTRVGYGDSGGIDVEFGGNCNRRDFAPTYAAAAEQTVAALKAAERLPHVDLSRGLVVGQSFGGMTSITLSTRAVPGLVGAVNFAGGGGGNPETRPGNPCSVDRLKALYGDYGAASKVPTLWLYSENDRFWGAELPKEWFATFVAAGGKGRYVLLPSYRDNGHSIFTGNPEAWKPAFEDFLREVGF